MKSCPRPESLWHSRDATVRVVVVNLLGDCLAITGLCSGRSWGRDGEAFTGTLPPNPFVIASRRLRRDAACVGPSPTRSSLPAKPRVIPDLGQSQRIAPAGSWRSSQGVDLRGEPGPRHRAIPPRAMCRPSMWGRHQYPDGPRRLRLAWQAHRHDCMTSSHRPARIPVI